jgi:uncharacterized protein (TIGR00255 family)
VRVEQAAGDGTEPGSAIRLDVSRVEAYLAALREVKERFGLPGEVDMSLVGRCERLLVESPPDASELVDEETLLATVSEAVAELVEMRRREGERLADDLRKRLAAIARHVEKVERLAPERLRTERERLRRSVRELAETVDVDADRIAREIAILADRWDISEEIVRARAHLEAFGDLLDRPDEEPVGKRLGFLAQELLREINTLGAKANDAAISRHVVEAKNELESLREQIENVE